MPYTAARRARGEATVDDEDIVVLRKPPKMVGETVNVLGNIQLEPALA